MVRILISVLPWALIRSEFFMDPFIKHLWGKIFVEQHSQLLVQHLRRLRSQKVNGQLKYERFMKDVHTNEILFNCTLIPPAIEQSDAVKVFTEQEAFEDLVENGKYNKKQAKRIKKILEVRGSLITGKVSGASDRK